MVAFIKVKCDDTELEACIKSVNEELKLCMGIHDNKRVSLSH